MGVGVVLSTEQGLYQNTPRVRVPEWDSLMTLISS